MDGQVDVGIADSSWHDIALLAIDHFLDLLHGPWRVKQGLSKREMPRELHIVLRHDHHESLLWLFNLHKVQDLQVVLVDLVSQRIRANVDDVDVWVLDTEYPRDLCILLLLEFLGRHSLELSDRIRIDMDFNALLVLDLPPSVLELMLHFSPNSD